GAGGGTIALDGSQIAYSGVSTVEDAAAVPSLAVSPPLDAQFISVVDGPIVGGSQTIRVASTDNPIAFSPIDFANKANVSIRLPGGHTVPINAPTPAAGLTALNLFADAGPNVVTLTARPNGVATAIALNGNLNQVNIASAGLMNNGSTSVDGGNS